MSDVERVTAGKGRRQRRPTGAPPPLPHPVAITTTAWLVLAALVLAGAFVAAQHTPWLRMEDRASTWVLRQLAGMRTPWLTDVANGINVAGSGWAATVLGLSVVILTMIFRRWRHLLVFMGSLLFLEFAGTWIYFQLSRPRPYGVTIIGSWAGYAGVSPPLAVLTIFLTGIVYCLAVPGRARSCTKAAVAAVVAVFGLARLYLGVDHPGDVLLGAALAAAIAVTAFRYFTPNEVFPVAYRRGRTAHVDVTGRRGAGDPPGHARPARPSGGRDQAGRPGIVRRLDPAAAAGRGRPGAVRVRQALHQGPRPRRPLVQAVADHLVRLAGG